MAEAITFFFFVVDVGREEIEVLSISISQCRSPAPGAQAARSTS